MKRLSILLLLSLMLVAGLPVKGVEGDVETKEVIPELDSRVPRMHILAADKDAMKTELRDRDADVKLDDLLEPLEGNDARWLLLERNQKVYWPINTGDAQEMVSIEQAPERTKLIRKWSPEKMWEARGIGAYETATSDF